MFVSLWHYIRGYVIVEVTGYGLDKFINLAVKNHIPLWKVVNKDGKIYMHTTIKGFKKLKPYAKKTRCRIKIIKKIGLPFLVFKHRRRSLFAIGSLGFVIAIYILCSFVWLVDVTGNEKLETSDIIACLEQSGYTTGKFKGALDLRQAEKTLMNTYPEIVWAGIEFEGTKMLVRVSEAVEKPEIHQVGKPSDLVAKRDALVTYIVADKGMPIVKAGDTVEKGDVLISGRMTLQDEFSSLYLTESIGRVRGKTGYSLKASLPIQPVKKSYTNEVAASYTIQLFQTKIPLFKNRKDFEYYDTLVTISQFKITDKFPLPFYFEKHEKVAYKPVRIAIEEIEAKDKLLGALYDELMTLIGKNAKVIKQEIIYTKESDHLIAELNAIVEESIVEMNPIVN